MRLHPRIRFLHEIRRAHATVALPSALIVLLLTVEGCADDPLSIETPAPGAPAQIVMTVSSYPGGRSYREETRIDSATRHYTTKICNDTPIGFACAGPEVVREGEVHSNTLQELFAATTRPAFRALSPAYSNPPGVTPPDGGAGMIEVVRNGSRRTVSWTSAAHLPTALVDFLCVLRAARGDPLLCD